MPVKVKYLKLFLSLLIVISLFSAISINNKKINVFIIGDSTVGNKKPDRRGWGDELFSYFDSTKVSIINKAIPGRSSRSFIYKGDWENTKSLFNPGDYLIIQFGHNDAGQIKGGKMRGSLKGTGNDTVHVIRDSSYVEIVHSYGWYINKYITEALNEKVTPIVLSQTPKCKWEGEKVERISDSYGKWTEEICKKNNVLFIDINNIVAIKYEKLGENFVCNQFFIEDHTHTTIAGAKLNAETVCEELIKAESKLSEALINKNKSDK